MEKFTVKQAQSAWHAVLTTASLDFSKLIKDNQSQLSTVHHFE